MIYIHLTYSGGLGWLLENLREFIFLDHYVYLSNMPHILQMPGGWGGVKKPSPSGLDRTRVPLPERTFSSPIALVYRLSKLRRDKITVF